MFEKSKLHDNFATNPTGAKDACVIVAGSGGSGGTNIGGFENRGSGAGGGPRGMPPRNSAPGGGNMGCSKNFATQTSGAGMFTGGSKRGGSGWYGGQGCGGFGASGGSGYLRSNLQNTVFAMGKGARDGGE